MITLEERPVAGSPAPECRVMPLRAVVEHREEWSRLVVRIGVGTCPHCGLEATAEAGTRGFCPHCAGEALAVLRSGGRVDG